jgi:hypothetical protein
MTARPRVVGQLIPGRELLLEGKRLETAVAATGTLDIDAVDDAHEISHPRPGSITDHLRVSFLREASAEVPGAS